MAILQYAGASYFREDEEVEAALDRAIQQLREDGGATATRCLKCGGEATAETRDTDEPLCWAHGGGDPPEVEEVCGCVS